jgi:hypothetical protein
MACWPQGMEKMSQAGGDRVRNFCTLLTPGDASYESDRVGTNKVVGVLEGKADARTRYVQFRQSEQTHAIATIGFHAVNS